MKKLSFAVVAIFMVTVTASHARKPEAAIRGGLNLSTLIGGEIDPGISSRSLKAGVVFGPTLDIYINDCLFLQPGLLYSMKGAAYVNVATEEDRSLDNKHTIRLHYLEVPASLGFKIGVGNRKSILFTTGPYLAFAVEGVHKISHGNTGVKYTPSVFERDGFRRFDFGWNAGAAYRYRKFFTGANYGVGIISALEKHKTNLLNKKEKNKSVRNGNLAIFTGVYF